MMNVAFNALCPKISKTKTTVIMSFLGASDGGWSDSYSKIIERESFFRPLINEERSIKHSYTQESIEGISEHLQSLKFEDLASTIEKNTLYRLGDLPEEYAFVRQAIHDDFATIRPHIKTKITDNMACLIIDDRIHVLDISYYKLSIPNNHNYFKAARDKAASDQRLVA